MQRTQIRARAFAECVKLTTVNWGKSLKDMDARVFEMRPALKSVSIPETVEWMGEEVFIDCDALTTVTIPSNVRQIGEREFYDCDALATVTLGAGLTRKAVATLAAGYVWSDDTTTRKTIAWKINPAKQTVTFKAQSKTVKYSKVKKANQSVAITKAKAKTTLTYAISKALKGKKNMKNRFSIASSTGKITVKKGTPKGIYKVTVKASAKKTGNYKAANRRHDDMLGVER